MKPKLLIRIAAGCVLFFAFGHTMGHLGRKGTTDPKELEVIRITETNKFDMFGTLRSYDENYTGMSLNLIFTLLAFTLMLWFVSNLNDLKSAKNILIPITLCLFGFAATGFMFFFPVPAITCVVAGGLLSVAIFQLSN